MKSGNEMMFLSIPETGIRAAECSVPRGDETGRGDRQVYGEEDLREQKGLGTCVTNVSRLRVVK